jgi:cysteine-rich repeat protein
MRRAFGAATGLLCLVALVAFYSPGTESLQRLLTPYHDDHPDAHCVDVWSNEWCTTQKAAGKCIDNYVLTKCLGTCGSCCIDEGDEKDVDYCEAVHESGQCFAKSSKCMKTCGVCELDAKLDCSFEEGRGGAEDFCFYQKDYSAGAANSMHVSSFNDKKWTGPRKASDKKYFAHLDSEISSQSDCVYLTSPWGKIEPSAVLSFDYNMWTRDYPRAMGSMTLDLLKDREEHGWEEIWKSTGTKCGDKWTKALIDLGSELGREDSGVMRMRFHISVGNDALSDMGIDNIELHTRVCGDGKRVFEFCDDGNAKSGDGCSAACEIEDGYRCVATDGADECTKLKCGDGVVSGVEECDDGNTKAGDGCSKSCMLETGYHCAEAPVPCPDECKPLAGQDVLYPGPSECIPVKQYTPKLVSPTGGPPKTGTDKHGEPYAEGVLTVFEKDLEDRFDDGTFKGVCPNPENWKLAQVACFEMGFAIGKMADPEKVPWVNGPRDCDPKDRGSWDHGFLCDEDAMAVGDCKLCHADCQEAAVVRCEYSGLCGDGYRRQSVEKCDDGNTEDGDGCSSTCQIEDGWVCSGGGWNSADSCEKPVCGDGFRTAGEDCDDGNSRSGDGCSSTCTVEEDYCCQGGSPTSTDTCTLFGTIRLDPMMEESPRWPLVVSGTLQVMSGDDQATCGWGSVCFDGFDLKDANNACEQIGLKYVEGAALFVQSPGIESVAVKGTKTPEIKFSGGCCQNGMPKTGLFYRCGVDAAAKCKRCDDAVVLTCGSDP